MYAELHCVSNYSFLRGASHPRELIKRAADLNYSGIALTDECSMAGVVKAHVAAKEFHVKLIVGSEFNTSENIKIVLLAPNQKAYAQICNLITLGRRRADKGQYLLSLSDLDLGCSECLAIWIPGKADLNHTRQAEHLKTIFADRLWIGIELFPDGYSDSNYEHSLSIQKNFDMPLVATGDVHMHQPNRKALLDVLSSIRIGQPVSLVGKLLFSNREKYLRSHENLLELYPENLLKESVRIAEMCHFSLDTIRYEYPKEITPAGTSPSDYLRQLAFAGALKRWPKKTPPSVVALIEKELRLISEMAYESYFLTVFDIVQYAKSRGILCQGRGSAANSAVCYCLGITEVDPSKISLLFERFISKERNEPPDIDVDFEHERREEVIQYIYKKYGRDRAALAATVITYRLKSAVRDVGKALGFSLHLIDRLTRSLSWWENHQELERKFRESGIDPNNQRIHQFLVLVKAILGFPRHLSQHVGGFVISDDPISALVPIENAAMQDRTIIQWDKDDLEALGLLKVDVLALGMLSSIRRSIDLINNYRGSDLSLASIPSEDRSTYEMLQEGDSIGVFQVESRAQMSMLPRLKPKNFYDLVIEVAIVRPGPIQGKMVHPYLKRRNGEEEISYANDDIKAVLERTLGVPIFQEQVIRLAVVAAGFSPGEADQLRRAMAAWKRKGGLDHFQKKLITGMLNRGHSKEFAERIFDQIKGFGVYGFPESHAASFALLVYISAWIKKHEPAAFYCGLLNSQPMGFYSPSQLIQDAHRHNIKILPVDIKKSVWESVLETPEKNKKNSEEHAYIRLGFHQIKGFKKNSALNIEEARKNSPIKNIEDAKKRAALDKGDLEKLTESGAFKSLSGNRHQTHWEVLGLPPDLPIFRSEDTNYKPRPRLESLLPSPTEADDLRADYQNMGLTLGRHPLAMLREQKSYPFRNQQTADSLKDLRKGQIVNVSGIVTGRQRPSTASGVLFLTLEDETNNINVIIWKNIFERYKASAVQGNLLTIKGTLEKKDSIIHVIAKEITDISHFLETFSLKSRDFH